MNYKILRGDNLESIKNISDHSIDSVVTDPPYENFDFIGMEMEDEYCDIAEARIKYVQESGE